MGKVTVDVERCRGCAYCVIYCKPKVLALSKKLNATGYPYAELIDDRCTGCQECAWICPEVAIEVYR